MPATSVLNYIEGRESCDCAVAALAMYLGLPYEDVLREVAVLDKRQGRAGLYTSQIRQVAEQLGTKLVYKRKVEEDDYGILLTQDHAAIVRSGLVIDPAGGIWDYTDYVKARKARVTGVLVEKENS